MLRFFRTIRYSLMDQPSNGRPANKTAQYLKYALGEIILVVIGILLALQINVWNEDRMEQKLEQDYYCRLLEDVENDALRLSEQQARTKDRLAESNKMLAYLQGDQPNSKEVISTLIKVTRGSNSSNRITTSAFEDIKSSGNLNILQDLELKQQLTNYYAESQRILDNISANNGGMDSRLFRQETFFSDMGGYQVGIDDNGFDSTLVDMQEFGNINYSPAIVKQLKDIALSYVVFNARNIQHFNNWGEEIEKIKEPLEMRCPG